MIRSPDLLGSVSSTVLIPLAGIAFCFALWGLTKFRRISRRFILRDSTLGENAFWFDKIGSISQARAIIQRASRDLFCVGIIYILPFPRMVLEKSVMGAVLILLIYFVRRGGLLAAIALTVYMAIALAGACVAIAMLAADSVHAPARTLAIGIGIFLWYLILGWASLRVLASARYLKAAQE